MPKKYIAILKKQSRKVKSLLKKDFSLGKNLQLLCSYMTEEKTITSTTSIENTKIEKKLQTIEKELSAFLDGLADLYFFNYHNAVTNSELGGLRLDHVYMGRFLRNAYYCLLPFSLRIKTLRRKRSVYRFCYSLVHQLALTQAVLGDIEFSLKSNLEDMRQAKSSDDELSKLIFLLADISTND